MTKTPELYQEATRRIVLGGAKSTADAYVHGLRRVELARRDIAKAFTAIDVVVMPTTNSVTSLIPRPGLTSPPAGRTDPAGAPVAAGGGAPGFRNTSYFSYFGLRAISVPCGFTAAGLPVGLQIAGPRVAEAAVLALAHAYEQATEWHKRRPVLT